MSQPAAIRVGVSSCLLGNEVRYDGQHKRDPFLDQQLAPFVEFVPVCPEVELGMGIPREPVRLVQLRGTKEPMMLGNPSGKDWTQAMRRYARDRVGALAERQLCGYVLKSKSPSCGMERVKLHHGTADGARVTPTGVGLFAAELLARLPHLPIEEEGRLHDPRLRENFIERVFAYGRLQRLWARPFKMAELIAFHTNEKMALLAHSPAGYRALGALVGQGKRQAPAQLRESYQAGFMTTLRKLTTPGRHVNVLMHMLGHFSDQLEAADRQELLGLIDDHRRGLCPLVVPLTLLRHHVRRLQVTYLLGQTYLEPHPKELMLRNHV